MSKQIEAGLEHLLRAVKPILVRHLMKVLE